MASKPIDASFFARVFPINTRIHVFPDFGYWTTSAAVVLMCILGGVGSFVGPMVGAAIITLLEHYISIYTFYWQMVLGCLIIILVMFMPGGISGYVQEKFQKQGPGT